MSFSCDTSGHTFERDSLSPPAAAGQDCAGGAARKDRLSNTGIVNPELLYFGLDWIALFLGAQGVLESPFLSFFDSIFADTDNDDLPWSPTFHWPISQKEICVTFLRAKGDIMASVYFENEKIMSIRKVTESTTFMSSVSRNYQYQWSLYGSFFACIRIGKFELNDFLGCVVDEEVKGFVKLMVSQAHICADVESMTTNKVISKIKVKSKEHAKDTSIFNKNKITGLYETFYFGGKRDTAWFVRIYDKLVEMRSGSGKEGLYPQYWGKECVTRIELVCKRPALKPYECTLKKCIDPQFQLSLFSTLLKAKYVTFGICSFIESDLRKKGIEAFALKKIKQEFGEMSEEQRYQRLINSVIRTAQAFRVEPVGLLQRIEDEISSARPEKVWK